MALRDLAIADGAVAGYRFAEASGSYTDELGGSSGTATGVVTRITDSLVGYAVRFGGTNADGIDVPDQAVLDLGDGPLSIEMMLRRYFVPASGIDTPVLAKGTNSYGAAFIADSESAENANAWALNRPGFGKLTTNTSPSTDLYTWHHYVVTRSASGAGNTLVYKDGVEGHLDLLDATLQDTATALNIGREAGWRGFSGDMAELWLYNVVLSAAQIARHYTAAMVPGVRTPNVSAFPKAKLRRAA